MTFAQQLRADDIRIEIAYRELATAKAAKRATLKAQRQADRRRGGKRRKVR